MKMFKHFLTIAAVACFAIGAGAQNLAPGGDFESGSGALPSITFGDTPPQWGWSSYGNGGSCDYATDAAVAGSQSVKWVCPSGWDLASGHEFYYQNSVASVALGEYVYSGWIRAENKASNYLGPSPLYKPGQPTLAVQINDGSGYMSYLADASEIGYGASDAPTWELFGLMIDVTVTGPFNDLGSSQYFSIGAWRNNPTSTSSDVSMWFDEVSCVSRTEDTSVNLCPGGDFESGSGALLSITFGDTPPQWGWSSYGNGGSCEYATDAAYSGSQSVKWSCAAGWDLASGHEFYYQNSVASVALGEYVFTGWVRQENRADNWTGDESTYAPGALTLAVQINDGSGYQSSTVDASELGYGASDAPTWEPFAVAFEVTVTGPFNDLGSGQYFSIGAWRNNPTSTASGINTWFDDLACYPRTGAADVTDWYCY